MSTTTHTHTLPQTTQTGLTDSSTSSTSSADKYHLEENDENPILLYQYRGRLRTSSQKELCEELDKDETLRCTKKLIPRGTSYVDVRRSDLYLPQEKGLYADMPNYDSSLASIKVPFLKYLSRLIWGSYEKLYIVSPESSPTASQTSDDMRDMSPTDG